MCVIKKLVYATATLMWRETTVTHAQMATIIFQLVVLSVAAIRMEQLTVIRRVTKKMGSVIARQTLKVEPAAHV